MHEARNWYVDNAPTGRGDAPPDGSAAHPFRTIQEAAALAMPGETVIVRAGIYRERVMPVRSGEPGHPIRFVAEKGVEIRGTTDRGFTWKPDPDSDSCWLATQDPAGAKGFPVFWDSLEPFPFAAIRGQVIAGGVPLIQSPDSEALPPPGGFTVIEPGKTLRARFTDPAFDPRRDGCEYAVQDRLFAPLKRGLSHIEVEGFCFAYCANPLPHNFWSGPVPQWGGVSCRGGRHWVFRRNTIRYCQSIGLDCGAEGRTDADGMDQEMPTDSGWHLVENNRFEDNGSNGAMAYCSEGTVFRGNRFLRNNRLGYGGPETAGLKTHFFPHGRIEDNQFLDNACAGLWLDNVWAGTVVRGNVFSGNQGAGCFVELGKGPLLVEGNVFALTTAGPFLPGDGLYIHDAAGVSCRRNLFYGNAHFGLWLHQATDRRFRQYREDVPEPVHCRGGTIEANTMMLNAAGAISLPPRHFLGDRFVCDRNAYAGTFHRDHSETYAHPLDPATFRINSCKGRFPDEAGGPMGLDDWRRKTGFDGQSRAVRVLRPFFNARTLRLDCQFGPEMGAFGEEWPWPFLPGTVAPELDEGDWSDSGRGPYARYGMKPGTTQSTGCIPPFGEQRLDRSCLEEKQSPPTMTRTPSP